MKIKGGENMKKRREFIKIAFGFLTGMGLLLSPIYSITRVAYAKAQKLILPRGTKRESLIHRNPRELDTRNLDTTPLKDFGTMGVSDYEVNVDEWRLKVSGHVKIPLALTYSQILALPSIEKNVLLICPGFFANHGHWKGISMGKLLEEVKMEKAVSHVTFSGQKGSNERVETFPIEDILSNKVFLSYGVNGEALPKAHGFPLRVVAAGYYGFDWLKYVYKITLEKNS
jgi:DMSO/TMAO reductase YedYZ molybdopterin-dependent catalytic subunit